MSLEDLRQMNNGELCQWLEEHPDLHVSHREAAITVIQQQSILGVNFLNLTMADWKAAGLPLGAANSLVQISHGLQGAAQKTKSLDVRQMNNGELCQWLEEHPDLHVSHREAVITVIQQQSILGVNFLNCPEAKWEAFGLPWGAANSLVQISHAQTGQLKDNVFKDLRNEMPSPSSFSKDRDKGSWVNFLRQHPNKIICHRDISEDFCIPVCLLSPIFTEFVHGMDNIAVYAEDCDFVGCLTDSMCGVFDRESDRMDKFIDLFRDYTGRRLLVTKYDKSETDGSLNFMNGALYCNLEVKVEKGSGGGDPYMQGIAFYIKSLPNAAGVTQLPCFLLELCGTAFSVSGIVNSDSQIICDPLSPTYQLLCNPDFVTSQKIAKLFASLKRCLEILRSHDPNGFLPASQFPYVTRFHGIDSNSEFSIQYLKKMKGLLFHAKILGKELEVAVKFCSRYNRDVHLFCHSMGFAPALISCHSLGHYFVVVMEKLSLRPLSFDDRKNAEIRGQVQVIVQKLKEKRYVHGDMRESNVLFDTLGNRVVLVDFDWAGVDGIDVYPSFMNPALNWPEGASTGQPLRHEHDLYWFEDFFQ